MKTYRVAVGDKEYIVKVEEVAEGTVIEETAVASADAAPTSVTPDGDAEVVQAPLQGSVLSINVKPGDTVNTGDTVLVIEAMKLENEVVAAQDGVIQQVFVQEGQTVDAEDPLYSIA